MKERDAEDWYDYHEAEWETIAVILHSAPKCYLVKVLGGTSDYLLEQMIKSKGFKLDEIDWYRTEKR
jgi:hypothetical protein